MFRHFRPPKKATGFAQVRIDSPDGVNCDSVAANMETGSDSMLQDDLGGFGDARLRRVGAKMLDAMCQKPTTCIHALAEDRNQELTFGRFLDHSSVSYGEMLTTAGRSPASARQGATCWRSRTPRNSASPATPTANTASDDPATIVTSACFCTRPLRSMRFVAASLV
jgi:hypothetical protein